MHCAQRAPKILNAAHKIKSSSAYSEKDLSDVNILVDLNTYIVLIETFSNLLYISINKTVTSKQIMWWQALPALILTSTFFTIPFAILPVSKYN